MKGHWRTGWKTVAVLVASAAVSLAQAGASAPAQSQESASPYTTGTANTQAQEQPGPGAINYIEGQVSVDGQPVTSSDIGRMSVHASGAVNTQDGFAEILLSPGAFLRIGHNSEVRVIETGLAIDRVQVVRGQAQVEVDQLVKGTRLTVEVGNASTEIQKNGLYAFAADPQTIRVMDGKAEVAANGKTEKLTKGHEILLSSNQPLKKQDFDDKRAQNDPLFVWGRVRSQQESQASYSAARDAQSYAGTSGWVWNPYFNSYAFWPMNPYLYSPFGWGFYSPAYFGYGYPAYGGGVYYRRAFRPGVVAIPRGYVHGGGTVAHRGPAFHGGTGFHGGAGFHGGGFPRSGGFHGGGFHGGGHR